jgi:anhydro-N-acetylmuramic acid kinase
MSRGAGFYVGAISGTSVDGLDLALLAIDDRRIEYRVGRTVPFASALTQAIHDLAVGRGDDLDALGAADHLLGEFIAESVLDFLARVDVGPAQVRAIGSHGQTVRHRPDGRTPFTMQIGDPNRIAERTGIDCVADFRRRDMAAGGQGAPLVPFFHRAVFDAPGTTRVVANIGGIANITVLPGSADGIVSGFDTGPGNTLLDAWSRRHLRQPYDEGGAFALSGRVSEDLLARCLSHPYFALPSPKSTGREAFGEAWLDELLQTSPHLQPEDVQATLAALTVRSIADQVPRISPHARSLVVCGGGRRNAALMAGLASALPGVAVTTTDAIGIDGDYVEAAAFAWLAYRTTRGLHGNLPQVTGGRGERVLGAIYPGGSRS